MNNKEEILKDGPCLILDVEATCWPTPEPVKPVVKDGEVKRDWFAQKSEVIEIGVRIPSGLAVPGAGKSASFMIRPVINPILSDFCKQLTSITQEMVDQAEVFAVVMRRFDQWLLENVRVGLDSLAWGSWGFYDLNILAANAEWFNSKDRFREDLHINVKEMARRVRVDEKGVRTVVKSPKTGKFPVGEGLRFFGMGAFKGTQHRGVDDAINIGTMWDDIRPLFTPEDFVRHAGHSRSINEGFRRKNGMVAVA